MRIALLWNDTALLRDVSIRWELYFRGFQVLGHEPILICPESAAQGYEFPVCAVRDARELSDIAFWHRISPDLALVITWHRMADVLAAIRMTGALTVAIPDSDGQAGARVHFWASLERQIHFHSNWLDKIRCLKWWAQKYFLTHRSEAEPILESTRQSDVVLFESMVSREAFCQFLNYYGHQELAKRVMVMPLYPVQDRFLSGVVPSEKQDAVCAIGRWDSPQKNTGLLVRAIQQFLQINPKTEFHILGRGGETCLGPLAAKWPQVHCHGLQPPHSVLQCLAKCRSILFSSRWEGFPHSAHEALCMGCTVIGPPLPCVRHVCDQSGDGTVALSWQASALSAALKVEMNCWANGRRDPRQIADRWRAQLSPEVVCRRILAACS